MISQNILDKSSISISVACAVHCLMLPVITVMSPALIGSVLAEETFHRWLAFVVIPLSLVALFMGCRQHKRTQIVILGISGLAVLVFTALFGHDVFGELGEKMATVVGAAMIAVAHLRNYRACQRHHVCDGASH